MIDTFKVYVIPQHIPQAIPRSKNQTRKVVKFGFKNVFGETTYTSQG